MLRVITLSTVICLAHCATAPGQSDMPDKSEPPLAAYLPAVGKTVKANELYDASGIPFPAAEFKDHYTVLVFGCLT